MAEDYAELIIELRDNARLGFMAMPRPESEYVQWPTWKAAEAITALLAERDALREALKPIADQFSEHADTFVAIPDQAAYLHSLEMHLKLSDLRRLAALNQGDGG